MKTAVQILFDEGLFYVYDNADEVLKGYLHIEDNERRRRDLEELNNVCVFQ